MSATSPPKDVNTQSRDGVPSDCIVLEVHGAEPDTLADPVAVLELSVAYFDLVVRLAKDRGHDLGLMGLQVYRKCVAIAVWPRNIEEARVSARSAVELIRRAPTGGTRHRTAVNRVRRACVALPRGYIPSVRLAKQTLPMEVVEEPATDYPWSIAKIRVTPYKSGGKSDASVQFTSVLEGYDFTLEVTQEMARELGHTLYQEVDIEAEILRSADGRIVEGKVLEIMHLDDQPDISSWRNWFGASGLQLRWDEADRHEEELRGD